MIFLEMLFDKLFDSATETDTFNIKFSLIELMNERLHSITYAKMNILYEVLMSNLM